MNEDGLRRSLEEIVPRAWTLDGERIAIEIDTSIYSIEALLRAGYKFTDRCYLFFASDDGRPGSVFAVLTPKVQGTDPEPLVGEFANELLDQRLRESLRREFGDVQALIVAQAFSEGNLLDPERDTEDYRSDPRGVGRRR